VTACAHVVLDDFSIKVDTGMIVGLLGAKGTGKSTFLKILLGLLQPDSGRSRIAEEPSGKLSSELRGRLGYVPQQPAQFPWLTGKAMLACVSAFYPCFDKEYAQSLLDRWKVSLQTPIHTMSPPQPD
jgi:ABC-type multidrug transport system ATPase subunit